MGLLPNAENIKGAEHVSNEEVLKKIELVANNQKIEMSGTHKEREVGESNTHRTY